ncbi:MAG: nucleotidyl transferase AbiEii/AbiGii toxin family protein [Chitinophagales bacterium]
MNDHTIQLISIEAFLRRASQLNMPFMVKGSIITRQFLEDASIRHAADLDFVYMGEELTNVDEARKIFSAWATQVTELQLNDGVRFDSFQENAFWRSIDYAMSDDFPTVNTDLICYLDVGSEKIMNDRLGLDISFNLDISCPPEPLIYNPLQGESFWLEYTCPLPLQIAWKLHQTITRPREKDIFDLIHLLQHESYEKEMFDKTWEALWKECQADGVPIQRIAWFTSDKMYRYFLLKEKGETDTNLYKQVYSETAQIIGINALSSEDMSYFLAEGKNPYSKLSNMLLVFKNALNKAGFSELLFPDFWIQKPDFRPKVDAVKKSKSNISFFDNVKKGFDKWLNRN